MQTITAVIPTNRLDRWLDLAVASVLESTGVDIDLIVVLDGVEPDRPPGWFADSRVTVLKHEKSLGSAAAMQTAIVQARGDFIARLDGDDISRPNRLRSQAVALNGNADAVAVSSRTMRVSADGVETGAVRLPAGPDIRPHLLLSNVVPHSTLMFRKRSWQEVGGYDPSIRQMEDYDFILRLAAIGPIIQLPELLVDYRVHANQTSRGAKPFGAHISMVLSGRRRLARALGASVAVSELKNLAWCGAQWLRYLGIIRPGHER